MILMTSKAPVGVILAWWLLTISFCYGTQSDINCLRSIKESLEDPFQNLNYTWNFNNNTEGFICSFNGVECYNAVENRVINIRLSNMGLKGNFPRGLAHCKSLTGLDLSGNELYGTIPSNISKILPFVTSLDLSSNNLSGEIPLNLANCSYLNVLKLDNNQLTGQILPEFVLLGRIKVFSVANNRLSGQIPMFSKPSFPAECFAGNPGLCGEPLSPCGGGHRKKTHTGVIAAAAVGGMIVGALLVGFGMLFFCPGSLYRWMNAK